MSVRPQLFGIAYRMLGSTAEAEDVVQDVWIRWQGRDHDCIRDPTAFLVTATTRVCLNVLQSARARHETYFGPWLPEPVDTSSDPSAGIERHETVQYATLVLLETLLPAERAAFLLREAFDYPYATIAEILGVTGVNARQLTHRARARLAAGHRRTRPRRTEHLQLVSAFMAAANGRISDLEELCSAQLTH
ncbi:MAG: sigma-70 family RNA polymerase sigma factor [Mycobacterium sp.]